MVMFAGGAIQYKETRLTNKPLQGRVGLLQTDDSIWNESDYGRAYNSCWILLAHCHGNLSLPVGFHPGTGKPISLGAYLSLAVS